MTKTRGQIESEITEAMVRFEREYMGRGPEDARTFIIDDMVLVRLKGVLTPAENNLAAARPEERGRMLVKQSRIELLEKGRELLEAIVNDVLGREVRSLHTDISTRTGERIIIFTLNAPPQMRDVSRR
ncbi:MAG: DUF2294 domain-containing protein [Verrucomicrobiota bacterium]